MILCKRARQSERLSNISHAIQSYSDQLAFHCTRLGGNQIGNDLHEDLLERCFRM